jgi:glycosyltransferase involved in cell wall biosynthesis
MNKLKIVLATHFPLDITKPHGGVEAVLVNLVPNLAKHPSGLDVHVVTLEKSAKMLSVDEGEGYYVHRLPCKKGGDLSRFAFIERKKLCDYVKGLNPDIVHCHDTYGIALAGSIDIPLILTIHGFIYEDTRLSGKNMPRLRSIIWEYFEKKGWSKFKHIISISPYVRERLRDVTNAFIYDIDNPISDSLFDIQRESGGNIIFSAAVICQRKNTINLVKAAHDLNLKGVEFKMRLAGKVTNDNYGDELVRLIDKYRLHDKVELLGAVSSEQVKKELSKASVFALVSLEENSPMGIEEAMAVGIPIITSNKCGMPYMVKNHESGFLVDPTNVSEISKRLQILLTDKNLNLSMGERAKNTALSRFHPKVVAEQTVRVYKELL